MKTKLIASLIIVMIFATYAWAVLTKTTALDIIDNWQAVAASTLAEGAAESISASYSTTVYIEVAYTGTTGHSGYDVIVEVSYADDDFVTFKKWTSSAQTPTGGGLITSTTLNDAAADAGDSTITLTAVTGQYGVPGAKWFIVDGTVANSETVRTKSISGSTITLCQDLIRAHADGLTVYDRVDEYVVTVPDPCAYVRVLVANRDSDCQLHFTSRASKLTGL